MRVAPISKTGPIGMVEIHGDDTAYIRAIVDNFLDQGRIITVDKNHLGLRIIDDIGHLGRCKPRITPTSARVSFDTRNNSKYIAELFPIKPLANAALRHL